MNDITLFDGKVCRKCYKWRAFSEYHKLSQSKDGIGNWCKFCFKTVLAINRIDRLKRIPDYDKIHNRKRRERNPEKVRELDNLRSAAKYLKRRDKQLERARQWSKENPEKEAAKRERRRCRLMGAEGFYTAEEWDALKKQYGNICLRCGDSRKRLTADHIVPISKGGNNYIRNIQPLCRSCNSKKWLQCTDYRLRYLINASIIAPIFGSTC